MGKLDRLLFKKNDSRGCLSLPWGYIHAYDNTFSIACSLKPLGQAKQNFKWSLNGKGERKSV